jgi:Predicted O-methyltransferase
MEGKSMSEGLHDRVDGALTDLLGGPSFQDFLEASRAGGLPEIAVSDAQGRCLEVLARAIGGGRVLELGTLGGFSTAFLARGVGAGGRVVSLELSPEHAAVAEQNLRRAGLMERVEIRVGPALTALDAMIAAGGGGFGLVFIDADKALARVYVERAIALTRPGGLIVLDNVVRGGRIADRTAADESTRGVREALAFMGSDSRLTAGAMQTVGTKGHDGFAIAVVT